MSSITLVFVIAIAIIVVLIGIALSSKGKHIKKTKVDYDEALRSGDKRRALEVGRAYYAALRHNDTLTIYDEQAIANDLKTMD